VNEDIISLRNRIKNYSFLFIAFCVIVFSIWYYNAKSKNIVPYNEYPEGNILVVRSTNLYPYKTMIAIYKNGIIKKSRILEEKKKVNPPKEEYKDVKELSSSEIVELQGLINDVENHKSEITSTKYENLLIKTSDNDELESASNYDSTYVDALNEYIDNLNL